MGSSATVPPGLSHSSVQHVNGLSVYQEGRSPTGEQGAFMVSAIVAATPREVFSVMEIPISSGQSPSDLFLIRCFAREWSCQFVRRVSKIREKGHRSKAL